MSTSPDPTLCPVPLQESLQAYAEVGTPPGDFLRAVLCNDLRMAFGLADAHEPVLKHIVAYINWEIPSKCHGSHDKVTAHLRATEVHIPTPKPEE